MITDKELELSSEQAVTASAASTNYIDLGVARDVGVAGKLQLAISVPEGVTASGSATVTFQLQCDDNTSFSSPKNVLLTDAIGKADLPAGKQFYLPLPVGLDERYVRLYYTVATGPLTGGKFTAQLVQGIQASKAYPDAL